jgi:hypothetical protein
MNSITFYDYIQPIFHYLHSIRKINEPNKKVITFDMKFPIKWLVKEHIEESENIFLKLQDSTVDVNLFSFVGEFNEDMVNKIFDRIIYIIDKNIEIEKKQELLQQKISELQNRFNNMSLEELKQLKFTTHEESELVTNDGATAESKGV